MTQTVTDPQANFPAAVEAAPRSRERRNRNLTIWVGESLAKRVAARCASLPHRPTISSWAALVIEQHLDRLEAARKA
jgi:hypothetical protein